MEEEKKDHPIPRTLVLLSGLPGTGKGTTTKHLSAKHAAHVLSMGDMLRDYRDNDRIPELTDALRRGMEARLVEPDVVWAVLLAELVAARETKSRVVVLDGIPRTRVDAENALGLVSDFDRCVFLVLRADDEVLVDRCVARGRGDSATREAVLERIQVERKAFEGVAAVAQLQPYRHDIDASGTPEDMCERVDRCLGLH